MAVSGSYDYTVSALNVIDGAFENIQVEPEAADYTIALRALNLQTKEWMGKPAFAPGMKRWTRRYIYLFLRLNRNVYKLGSIANGGDYAAVDTYNITTLAQNAAANATTIYIGSVTSAPTNVQTGTIAATNYIGILLNSGDFYWTTVTSNTSGTIVIPSTGLPSAASSGNQVFSFPILSQVNIPLDILTLVRRDINGIDYPMEKLNDVWGYEQIANKNITATPTQWFYEKKLLYGNMYTDCFQSTVTDVFRMAALYPIDDEDSTADTMAFPQQWYGALEMGLSKRLAPKYGKSWTSTMEQNYMEAMASAAATDPEVVYQYFQPGRD